MIRPISVVSDGYLSITKRALVIAVAGYLNFGGEVAVPPSVGGGLSQEETRYTGGGKEYRVVSEDEEAIMITLQAFMICRE